MGGHIHTDAMHALFILGVVVVGLHAMRTLGAAMASKGLSGPGNLIGGLATFN